MMFHKMLRNSIMLTLLVFSVLINLGVVFADVYPPWYDLDQPYRTPYNITWSSGTAISNLTVNITINSSSMGSNFNFSEHKDSLRVVYFNTSTNASQEVSHYALSWDNTSSNASIQFLAVELKASTDTTYWLYYGDGSKTDADDYCGTFIYCDEFDDGVIDSRLLTTDQDGDSGTIFDESNGVFNLSAGGADIWTGSDEYGALYVPNIVGDIDIRVGYLAQQNTNAWAKAGPAIKNDMTAAGSSTGYAIMARTISNGYAFQWDNNNNGFLDSFTGGGSPTVVPTWTRLVKEGTQTSAFYSKVDAETWTQVGSAQTISSIQTTQDVGLIVTSHNAGTLSKVEFDNFTIRRYTTDTYSFNNGSEEELANIINTTLEEPTTLTITNVVQNETILFNMTVFCTSFTNSSCGNVSSIIQYNNSGSGFANISNISGMTPLWITTQDTPWCVLDYGENCSQSWSINVTGTVGSTHLLRAISYSNVSNIINYTTGIPEIGIIAGNSVRYNQTTYDFGSFTRFSGNQIKDISVESDNGNNTNMVISCQSGDCGLFSDNWSDTTALDEGESSLVRFTCLDSAIGTYSAVYNLTSDEYDGVSLINLTCEVEPVYGPLFANLVTPIAESNNSVLQNRTELVNMTASCTGLCGNVSAYLVYAGLDDWWNTSFLYRTPINITTITTTNASYNVYLNLSSSELGSNFDWSRSCNDIRFANGTTRLDYWIESCNSTLETAGIWITSDTNISSSETYSIFAYYGNDEVANESNITATFIEDSVFLITGNCPSSDGACNMMDNNADADIIRGNIGEGTFTVDGSDYVTQISQPSNLFGGDDDYYSRYRFLYLADETGSHNIGVASDDGSEIGVWGYDQYGPGINATATASNDHNTISTWYGGHASGTCGSSGAIDGSVTLQAGVGYWFDYIQQERGGGQDAEACIQKPSSGSYDIIDTSNFAGQLFAREYVTPEPEVTNYGVEETLVVTTNSSASPFYAIGDQPQSCIMAEGGSCSFDWELNATGPVNSTGLFEILVVSNYSQVEKNFSQEFRVNITDNVLPTIVLYDPADNAKIISNGTIDFIFLVDDNDAALNCSLFVDSSFVTNTSCLSGVNTTITYDAGQGYHSWFITVNDSDTNSATSTTRYYTAVFGKNGSVSKAITSIAQNMYLVTLNITNYLAYAFDFTLYDFVDTPEFAAGSFNSLYNFTNTTNGTEYNGTVYGWNLTLDSNESRLINYSIISSNSTDYSLIENWGVALE